jgi:hypothetical protein
MHTLSVVLAIAIATVDKITILMMARPECLISHTLPQLRLLSPCQGWHLTRHSTEHPSSLIVNGLDLLWDQGHLVDLFGPYGRLSDVKLVKPGRTSPD